MDRPRGRPRLSTRFALWVFIAVAIVNVPLTVHFALPFKWTRKPDPALSRAASKHGWPAPTPHEQPWPPPTDFSVEHHFGRTLRQAWSVSNDEVMPGRTMTRITHKIIDERYGWPLPCLRRTQRWWPDNQEWRIDAPWDTGVRLNWLGVILDPVIAAVAVWGAVFVPSKTRDLVLARRRRREGCCTRCGYPMGASPVCTECGRPLPAR